MKKPKILGQITLKQALFFTAVFVSIAHLLVFVGYAVLVALGSGLAMDSYGANGTFQLYNPLRRLLDGEVLARDFPFFHGVGVPLLHFPLFYIMGHNLFAVEVAKLLVSPLIFLISSFLIFWAYFKNVKKAVFTTSIFTAISLLCIDTIWAGNSLLGLRAAFPFIAATFMLWRPDWHVNVGKNKTKVNLYYPILYTLMGISVACGTEQGLAFILAYVLIKGVQYIRSKETIKKRAVAFIGELFGIALATYVVLSVMTLGHAHEALYYALVEISSDQGWYFGAPPNSFLQLSNLDQLFTNRMLFYMLPIIISGIIAYIIGIKRALLSKKETFIFSVLLLYGLVVFAVSATGYWAPSAQLIPLERAAGVILMAIVTRVIYKLVQVKKPTSTTTKDKRLSVLAFGLLVGSIIALGYNTAVFLQKIDWMPLGHIITESRKARHSTNDSEYVSTAWKKRLESFAPYIEKGASVWSTYTSVYDSTRHQKNGSSGGEDYIIHALGPTRRDRYTQDFITQKPDYAITLSPSYFIYEEWLWTRHWSFYKELQDNYTIIATNDSHVLWKRRAGTAVQKKTSHPKHRIQKDTNGDYVITAGAANNIRVFEVSVRYNAKSMLPMTAKLPRYLLELSGSSLQKYPVSLPPYNTNWSFPVALAPNDSSVRISPKVYSLIPGASLEIQDVSYREVTAQNNLYIYQSNFCLHNANKCEGINKR
ncbi:hypothetical protein EUA75_02825 [TM7 phylum sp. oral taxon 353]|nr:hypothetical protein EUA75_02825 [TM7 phylum sp. oral taxon 353]